VNGRADPPDGTGPAGLAVHACPVLDVRQAGRFARITISAPVLAAEAAPGQYVMVAVPGPDFHLRRPLSIHGVDGALVSLLVEVRGGGTRLLAAAQPGSVLELTGPLGHGFPLESGEELVLVGGGIGAAPLRFLAAALGAIGGDPLVLLGFRDAAQTDLLQLLQIPFAVVATEDGSRGLAGTVIDLLNESAAQSPRLFACGPLPMLAAVRDWAVAHDAHGFVSLEAHMACGTGACHGCVVPLRDGHGRVCVDGPVFPLEDLPA
jgi:NAD(P)H-flavin reductase